MTLYFLSDYGLADEFVGVVHAVLDRLAPGVPVVDLTHGVPPFDVVAGAATLARCAPFLGDGVVVAVVDPGVGTARRPIAVHVDPADGGPHWLVGPDNGLLLPAADSLGGVLDVVVLDPARLRAAALRPGMQPATTFDGRDVFAPAAAHLATGGDPDGLGEPTGPESLVPGPTPPRAHVETDGSVVSLVTMVVGVDRFGNVQLAADATALVSLGAGPGDPVSVTVVTSSGTGDGAADVAGVEGTAVPAAAAVPAAVVRTFAACPAGGLGLLVDATGHLALVVDRASAADRLVGSSSRIAPHGLVGTRVRLERRHRASASA